MTTLSKLKNINITLKRNDRLLGFGSSPGADWLVIFFGAATLTLLMIGLGIYVFIKIDKGEIFQSERMIGQNAGTIDQKLLVETVEYYEAKASKFEEFKNSKVNSIDPSL